MIRLLNIFVKNLSYFSTFRSNSLPIEEKKYWSVYSIKLKNEKKNLALFEKKNGYSLLSKLKTPANDDIANLLFYDNVKAVLDLKPIDVMEYLDHATDTQEHPHLYDLRVEGYSNMKENYLAPKLNSKFYKLTGSHNTNINNNFFLSNNSKIFLSKNPFITKFEHQKLLAFNKKKEDNQGKSSEEEDEEEEKEEKEKIFGSDSFDEETDYLLKKHLLIGKTKIRKSIGLNANNYFEEVDGPMTPFLTPTVLQDSLESFDFTEKQYADDELGLLEGREDYEPEEELNNTLSDFFLEKRNIFDRFLEFQLFEGNPSNKFQYFQYEKKNLTVHFLNDLQKKSFLYFSVYKFFSDQPEFSKIYFFLKKNKTNLNQKEKKIIFSFVTLSLNYYFLQFYELTYLLSNENSDSSLFKKEQQNNKIFVYNRLDNLFSLYITKNFVNQTFILNYFFVSAASKKKSLIFKPRLFLFSGSSFLKHSFDKLAFSSLLKNLENEFLFTLNFKLEQFLNFLSFYYIYEGCVIGYGDYMSSFNKSSDKKSLNENHYLKYLLKNKIISNDSKQFISPTTDEIKKFDLDKKSMLKKNILPTKLLSVEVISTVMNSFFVPEDKNFVYTNKKNNYLNALNKFNISNFPANETSISIDLLAVDYLSDISFEDVTQLAGDFPDENNLKIKIADRYFDYDPQTFYWLDDKGLLNEHLNEFSKKEKDKKHFDFLDDLNTSDSLRKAHQSTKFHHPMSSVVSYSRFFNHDWISNFSSNFNKTQSLMFFIFYNFEVILSFLFDFSLKNISLISPLLSENDFFSGDSFFLNKLFYWLRFITYDDLPLLFLKENFNKYLPHMSSSNNAIGPQFNFLSNFFDSANSLYSYSTNTKNFELFDNNFTSFSKYLNKLNFTSKKETDNFLFNSSFRLSLVSWNFEDGFNFDDFSKTSVNSTYIENSTFISIQNHFNKSLKNPMLLNFFFSEGEQSNFFFIPQLDPAKSEEIFFSYLKQQMYFLTNGKEIYSHEKQFNSISDYAIPLMERKQLKYYFNQTSEENLNRSIDMDSEMTYYYGPTMNFLEGNFFSQNNTTHRVFNLNYLNKNNFLQNVWLNSAPVDVYGQEFGISYLDFFEFSHLMRKDFSHYSTYFTEEAATEEKSSFSKVFDPLLMLSFENYFIKDRNYIDYDTRKFHYSMTNPVNSQKDPNRNEIDVISNLSAIKLGDNVTKSQKELHFFKKINPINFSTLNFFSRNNFTKLNYRKKKKH